MNHLHERANLLVELGRYEQALPVFTEALSQADDADERAEIFADMAGCLAKLSRFVEAEQLYRNEVLPYLSADEWVMHQFVMILFSRQKLKEAANINQQLMTTYPGSSMHYVVEAKLLGKLRHFGAAWTAVQEARRLDPDDDYAQTEELSLMASWVSSTREPITPPLFIAIPEWENFVEQALARAPNDPLTRLLVGEIYAKNGQPANAQHHLLEALQLNSSYRPYLVDTLQRVLAHQHPLMKFCFGWLRRYADTRIEWIWGVAFVAGLGLKPLASYLGKKPLSLVAGVGVLLAFPPILIYTTSWMLVEFTPLGQAIMSRQDKWWSRGIWLVALLIGGSLIAFALSILT